MDARVVFVENSPSVGAREACVRAIYSISTRNELDTLFHLYAQNPLVSSLFVLLVSLPYRQRYIPTYRTCAPPNISPQLSSLLHPLYA